ncbi:MFS transporter [Paludifilum halophilum]|nr:MFS transporter [Paludifilum halophilum]
MQTNPATEVDPDASSELWSRNFILICLTNFLVFVSFQIFVPTLPLYVDRLGGSESAVGVIVGAFTLSAVVIRPWLGRMVDTHGRRGIYLVGLLFFFATTLAYFSMTTVFLLFILRVLHGFSWGAVTTAASTIATDLIPDRRRGEGMGYYGLFTNLAVAFGPALGLWVVERYSFPVLFAGAAGLVFAAWATAVTIQYPAPRRVPAEEESRRDRMTAGVLTKGTLATSAMGLCVTFTLGGIVAYLPLFAQERGIPHAGWFFTVFAVTMVAIRPWAGKLFDRQGPRLTIPCGLISLTLSLALLSVTDSLSALLTAAALYGTGFGAVHPSLQAWTIQRSPSSAKGRANGIFFASFDLGLGIGSILSGLVVEQAGFPAMFLTAATSLVPAYILFLRIK